jgi:hypothetical protein
MNLAAFLRLTGRYTRALGQGQRGAVRMES